MELILFAALSGLAGLFVLAAAISKDRTNLIPAGLIFMFLGIFLIIGPGLQIQTGLEYSYGEINGTMEVVQENYSYEKVQAPTDAADFNEILGLALTLIGVYFMGIATAKSRFFSLMRR